MMHQAGLGTAHRRSVARLPTKTVNIDAIKLRGAAHSRGADVGTANTIFSTCDVRFRLRRIDPSSTDSDTWLGGDSELAVAPASCGTSTAEEQAAFTGVAAAPYNSTSRIRALYVRSLSHPGVDALSHPAVCGSPTREMAVVSNAAGRRELAHELGHILLNAGNSAHSPASANLMADPDPGTDLTAAQCTTIRANC
jgi:hypothetical protein